MAESTQTKISYPQIDTIVKTVIQCYKSKGLTEHVITLGEKLIQEKLIEKSGWEKVKKSKKDFILVKLLEYIDTQLHRTLPAAETIMDWMSKFSHGKKDWVNLKEDILNIAIDHLEEKPEFKTMERSNYEDRFQEHGFEVMEKVASTLFEAISATPGHFEGKSVTDIKTAIKEALKKSDTPPCQWNGSPSKSSWVSFWNQNYGSGHPFVLHYLSEIYKIRIHVVCLWTRSAVCFYPRENVLECECIYLGRVGDKKYVCLQPLQSKEEVRGREHEDEEYSHMREDNARLRRELDAERKENKSLKEQITKLEKTIEDLKVKLLKAENDKLVSKLSKLEQEAENDRLVSKLSKLEQEHDELKAKEITQSEKIASLEQDLEAAKNRIGDLEGKFETICDKMDQLLHIGAGERGDIPIQTSTPLPPIGVQSAQEAVVYNKNPNKKRPPILKVLRKSKN